MAPLPAPAEKPSHRVSDSQSHAKVRPPAQVAVFCAALRLNLQPALTLGLVFPEERRYLVRSASERVNGRLKDEFGGRHVRVRGYDKVLAHLMFGMTVLTASQLMRLIVPPI